MQKREYSRHENQGGHRCAEQTSDHSATQRRVLFASVARAYCHWDHANDHGEGGHQNRSKPREAGLCRGLQGIAVFSQPLAGECAARREVLEAIPFVGGYGVDLGLLIDISERFGIGGCAECDLGQRVHRNRPLAELSGQALAVLQLGLSRAGVAAAVPAFGWTIGLLRPGADAVPVTFVERPALSEVPAHRKTA